VVNGTGVKSGVSWMPDGVSLIHLIHQEQSLMVTSFSKLLFYSAVIYWSSSLCFNPTAAAIQQNFAELMLFIPLPFCACNLLLCPNKQGCYRQNCFGHVDETQQNRILF